MAANGVGFFLPLGSRFALESYRWQMEPDALPLRL
ncbi:hypothetical protein I41_55670 [Lacipirellula limnantheis]|uniref:Uncharacterized protein n=1 Tax=Lacipirellula limnantheis TaxID=2528024 RepID=A0A517U6Q8_9BACT|nr:hypothetical protein I41_55670 [Lacipirellula limnantheis]